MRLSAESRYASFGGISFRIEQRILPRIEPQVILIPLKTLKNLSKNNQSKNKPNCPT
jgi:hypothetical protein